MTDEPITKRHAALVMLRLGYCTLSEVARLADVDRQLVAYWAKADGLDVSAVREMFLQDTWVKAMAGAIRSRPKRQK